MTKVYFYNENCFDTMSSMKGKNFKVDVILTSPPYCTSRSTVKTEKAIDTYNRRYDICLDDMDENQYRDWTIDLFNNFNSILKENGVILYNISYGSENPNAMWRIPAAIIENTDFMVADCIIWKKKSALPNNVGNKLTRIIEYVFVICRKSEFKTFNINKKIKSIREDTGQKYYENVYNFIEAPNNDGSCKLNKATYSSELCLKLLDLYAKEDYVVYDPFMGTGTTAVGSIKYNDGENTIKCIGSELSSAQVEYSVDRIKTFNPNVEIKVAPKK